MFLINSTLGIALGAGLGAAIGYSQLLCPDGGCAITGSWYGGAMFGGIMGLALTGAIGGNAGPGSPSALGTPESAGPHEGQPADSSESDSTLRD